MQRWGGGGGGGGVRREPGMLFDASCSILCAEVSW